MALRPAGSPSDHSRQTRPQPRPFQRFFQTEAAGGALLLFCACFALIAANSPWADVFAWFWSIPVSVGIMNHTLSLTLRHWINDGLMAVFFLLVGLEIKREVIAGELSSPRHAALPIAGAVGGMVLPAVIYLLLNHSGVEARGWGVPMATDIAFVVGVLTLMTPNVPVGAKVFLTALAIVDDVGAVLVIALFYTTTLHWGAMLLAGCALAGLVALNRLRVQRLMPYLLLGGALWLFVLRSGIHATIAGVLLAFTIPARSHMNSAQFSARARALLDDFDRTETGDFLVLTSKGQQDALASLSGLTDAVTAPLLRIETALHGFSAFVVMPLFALANAGVSLSGSLSNWQVLVGIAVGLAVGKPLGIISAAAAAVGTKAAALPRRASWSVLHGCAAVGGIGFTMSLFIANLAFEGTPLLDTAKVGILAGSLFAGVAGTLWIRVSLRRTMHVP